MKYTPETREQADAAIARWQDPATRPRKNRELAEFYNSISSEPVARFMNKSYAKERIGAQIRRLMAERDSLTGIVEQPKRIKERRFSFPPRKYRVALQRANSRRARLLAALCDDGLTFQEVCDRFGWEPRAAYRNLWELNRRHGYGLLTCPDGKIRAYWPLREWEAALQ